MLTNFMKWIAIASLLSCLFIPVVTLRALLPFVVAAAAVVVLVQATKIRAYGWMATFAVVACLFNPVVPVDFSRVTTIALETVTLVLFGLALRLLRTPPKLSIASITDRMPGSESL